MTSVNDLKMKINGEWVSVLENAGRTNVIPTLTSTPLGSIGTCRMQSSDMVTGVYIKTYTVPYENSPTKICTFTLTPTAYEYSTMPDYYKIDPSFTGLTDTSMALISMRTSGNLSTGSCYIYNSTTQETVCTISGNDATEYTFSINSENLNDIFELYGYQIRSTSTTLYNTTITCVQNTLYASTGGN